MKKCALSVFVSVCIMIGICVPMVYAEDRNAVYTEFSSGNNSHMGNGTRGNPYNLFTDALDAVADGGTIYICDGGAFVNDENDGMPLVIDKNVTVKSADVDGKYNLTVRKGGIVIGGNTAFENVYLEFPNNSRPAICANGYELTFSNVSYNTGANKIHIFGGSMYDRSGKVSLSPEKGGHSKITISGNSVFGNVYAGGLNSSFDKPVDITLNNISNKNIAAVYAGGAWEGIYNENDFLNPDNKPTDPTADTANLSASGLVNVNINESSLRELHLKTGALQNGNLTVQSKDAYSCNVENAENIYVKSGIFAPLSITDGTNIKAENGTVLDISAMPDCIVKNFNADGAVLVLDKMGFLKIKGEVSGICNIKTEGGSGNASGIMEYSHIYIDASEALGDGSFTIINPYPTQTNISISKNDSGMWVTSDAPEDITELESFSVLSDEIEITEEEINESGALITALPVYTEDTVYPYMEYVPFGYSVRSGDEETGVIWSQLLEEYESYEGNAEKFNMNFTPSGDEITISRYSETYGIFSEIKAGIYNIEIFAPTKNGMVTEKVRLAVKGNSMLPAEEVAAPTVNTVVYGTKLYDITLSDGWKWLDKDKMLEVGTSSAEAYIEVDDSNYDYSGIAGYDSKNHRVVRKVAVTVEKAETKTSLQYSADERTVVLTVIVSGADGGAIPGGEVILKNGGAEIAKLSLVNGKISYTMENVEYGNYAMTAEYVGDGNYLKSSNSCEFAITAKSIWNSSTENGTTKIEFANLFGKDIADAQFIVVFYKDDSADKVDISSKVSLSKGQIFEYKFSEDISEYEQVTAFIWYDAENIEPICQSYNITLPV